MSIQKETYTSKKTGKTTVRYHAYVWVAAEHRNIIGPARATEKLARQDEVDIGRQLDHGEAPASAKKRRTKINEIYEEWHKATEPPVLSNNTWQVYGRFYRDYIQDVFGDQPVASVTPLHIQRYVNLMKDRYSAETVNKCLNVLIDIFDFAATVLKCRPDNPASGVKRCKVAKKKKTTWSDAQITYFLSLPEVKASHYYPMFCLSAALGPRPGEVCGLSEKSLLSEPCYAIDFDRGYDNYRMETDLKTAGSHRTPPIPAYLYQLIRKRLMWKRRARILIPDWGNNDYLFVSQNGRPIPPHQYGTAFRRLLSAYNARAAADPELEELPAITLYGFRTSFATNNMRRTPNAALISSIMGNSVKTLLQFYAQTDTAMQAGIIDNYLNLKTGFSEDFENGAKMKTLGKNLG